MHLERAGVFDLRVFAALMRSLHGRIHGVPLIEYTGAQLLTNCHLHQTSIKTI
jgi:hypothetical protein